MSVYVFSRGVETACRFRDVFLFGFPKGFVKFKVVLDVSFLRINARMQKYGKFVGKAKKMTVKCVVGVAGEAGTGYGCVGPFAG